MIALTTGKIREQKCSHPELGAVSSGTNYCVIWAKITCRQRMESQERRLGQKSKNPVRPLCTLSMIGGRSEDCENPPFPPFSFMADFI